MQKISFRTFLWLCVKKAWPSTWEKADLFTTVVGIAIGVIVHYFPKWETAVNHLYWEIPIAALASLSVYRLALSPFWIYRDKDIEVRELRRKLVKSVELAEEDPKVHLEPLTGEFATAGIIPFDVSNLGQRVNPAYRIKITIPVVPSVSFAHVNVLEMAQHKRVVPIVDCENPLSHHNILPELEKAWKNYAPRSSEIEFEFPFEIKVTYEDASGSKSFETMVSLKYCPTEAHAARRGSTFRQQEYAILKVSDVKIKRIS